MTDQANTTVSELLPCPFCGGEAIQCGANEHNPRHWVMCRDCHACPKGDVPILSDAIAAWNRRATADVTEDIVERGAVAIDALWSEDGTARSYPFPDTEASYQEHCRSTARAVLAALNPPMGR